jgi:hypothetical protein
MEITQADWEGTVEALTHARLRPQMWFAAGDAPAIMNFRVGLIFGLGKAGLDIQAEETKIAAERGWEIRAAHPLREMQEKGMSEAEINVEVFTILILAIQRLYGISAEPILKTHTSMRERAEKALQSNTVGQETQTRLEFELEMMSNLEKDLGIV